MPEVIISKTKHILAIGQNFLSPLAAPLCTDGDDAVKKGRTEVSPNSEILNQLSELAGKEGSEEEEMTVLRNSEVKNAAKERMNKKKNISFDDSCKTKGGGKKMTRKSKRLKKKLRVGSYS